MASAKLDIRLITAKECIACMFYFVMQMITGKARKRKWKEEKLMKEYAKVHRKDQEVAQSLPTAVQSVETSLCHIIACFC